MKELYTVLFLAANSWLDFRSREISLVLAGNLWDKRDYVQYFYRQTNWRYTDSGGNWNDVSCSRILSCGTVGVGDGWILAALGTLLSTEIYVQMLCMGLFFAAGWSGVLLAVFGKSRKTEIPLVPFLLAGYIGAVLL